MISTRVERLRMTDANNDRLKKRLATLSANKAAPPKLEPKKAPPPAEKKRKSVRTPTFREGRVIYSGRHEVACIIKDLTEAGARIVLDGEAGLPPEVVLVISQSAAHRPATVVWQKQREVGLSFANGPK
jgi:hypothetical protein